MERELQPMAFLRTALGLSLILHGSAMGAGDLCSDAAAALPPQISNFGSCVPKLEPTGRQHTGSASLVAERTTDGFTLRASVYIGDSPADAAKQVDYVFADSSIPNTYTPHSYTGRKLAPTVWHSHPPGKSAIVGSTSLMACDGRVFVRVISSHRIPGRANGKPILQRFTDADLGKIEDLMATIFNRSSALGYASRASRTTSTMLRREVEQRRNVLRATPPKPTVRPPSPNPMIPPPLAERWSSNQPPPRKR